ncbi:MAG: hypothetical protein ABS46_03270 [Cytophagaceae bacterium SCN 52-12]|nr:MAG: hypothetical protein ABS46_03270 [Cytophagaceae bacterium SCN 52-12]
MKPLFRIGVLILISFRLAGQSALVEGRVADKGSGQALIGAVVTALSLPDSAVVRQTTTTATGKFGLLVPHGGRYALQVTYVGYETAFLPAVRVNKELLIQAGDLMLKEDAVLLGAVSVSGKRAAISQGVDRMSVDVSGSAIAEGNNVLELLERTPGISMQGEGSFAVNGREGAKVMLDGRTTYLSGPQLALLLKGMQARDVGKIEIMSSPSARQDAEGSGGLINIITKKNRRSSGWSGDVFSRGTLGRRPQYAAGGGLSYKTEKLNVFLNASHGYDESRASSYNERIFTDSENGLLSTRQHDASRTDPGRNYAVRGGFEFTPDTSSVAGFSANWIKGRYLSFSDSELGFYDRRQTLLRQTKTRSDFDEIYNNLTYSLYYNRRFRGEGHELKIAVDYAPHGNAYDNGFYTRYFDERGNVSRMPSARRNVQDLGNTTYAAGIDYVLPAGKDSKIEVGWKGTYLCIDNSVGNDTLRDDTEWMRDNATSNAFRYGQHLQAGYLIYSSKFKKLSYQAGLRGEYTGTLADQVTLHERVKRHYFDLFPNLYLNYPLSDRHHARLAYSRRIARPGDHDVNIFRGYEDPFNYWEGNAFLRPSKTHVLELGHAFDNQLFTTVSYNRGTDVIMHIARIGEQPGETLTRPENVGTFANYGLSIMYNTSFNSWWDVSSYLNGFRNEYRGSFGEVPLDNSANSWSANTRHSLRLSEAFQLEGVGYYRSGTASGVMTTAPAYGLDVSVSRSLAEKKLMIRLAGTGIIRNGKPETSALYGNLRSFGYARPDNRKVTLSLSYRFE